MFDHLNRFHQFLARQALYPILLSTLLAISLFAGRVYLMEKLDTRQSSTSLEVSEEHPSQKAGRSGRFGLMSLSVSSWIDESERSFVQSLVEFSPSHSFRPWLQIYEKPSKFGTVKVSLDSREFGDQRALVQILAELSISRTLTYAFLVWNLFLAWIPYLSGLWAASLHQRYPARWWTLIIPGALWLSFFPNAPYIVTDFLHLQERAPIPLWYDIGMLTVFAWTGLLLAVFSLRTMQTLVKSFLGSAVSWLFVVGSLGLGGLGIYIGRFLRWNSWDLLLHPRSVLADVIIRLANPWNHPGTLGVTFLFGAFLLVCYLTFSLVPSYENSALRGGESRR